MRKLRVRVCDWCGIEFESRREPACCSKQCANEKEAKRRKETGFSKVISARSAKTMHENGWYGSDKHLRAAAHMRQRLLELGVVTEESKRDPWVVYRQKVWNLTKKVDVSVLEHYEKRGRSGVEGAYQLDHKYSVRQGFEDGIDPEIIASIKNLEFIPWEKNIKKKNKCSIELKELSGV